MVNPFMDGFDANFVEVVSTVPSTSPATHQVQYTVTLKPNYYYISDKIYNLYVEVEERPQDHFFVSLGKASNRLETISFTDQKVTKGETYRYTFYLMYEGKKSNPNKDYLDLTIE